ncbi:MAG: hypothetical protein Q8P93_02220 [bacterium]|nr:hypothetical protein [bacterium]
MKGFFKFSSIVIVIVVALLLILWALDVLPQTMIQETFIDTLLVLIIVGAATGMVGLLMRHQ